jgi:hypothetical protein
MIFEEFKLYSIDNQKKIQKIISTNTCEQQLLNNETIFFDQDILQIEEKLKKLLSIVNHFLFEVTESKL